MHVLRINVYTSLYIDVILLIVCMRFNIIINKVPDTYRHPVGVV